MSRNLLFLIIGILAVGGGILGYMYYVERQKTESLEITIDKGGIVIEKK